MDVISFATMYSLGGKVHVTIHLNSSFYSTVKIHETVEIEGRLTGTKGNIKAVMVKIRREGNREVIARGSLWMAPLALGLKDLTPLHKSSL
ncbi:unnamed protein product [Thlaspi arvense]|uniref:Thioesterase domain-containing protein n=1 Tax=Thlaspi arvense TaxID=13288 RepID=A0AAU9RC02_THLAR|nr:unnamed protein product [Thlaspi arvense]